MSTRPSAPARRGLRAPLAAATASGLAVLSAAGSFPSAGASDDLTAARDAIRPFRVQIPDSELLDLRRRIATTRWPERETVVDDTQGVPLEIMKELTRYWATDYDWRRCEAKLNALPQFVTEIDGLDIHFLHVRS